MFVLRDGDGGLLAVCAVCGNFFWGKESIEGRFAGQVSTFVNVKVKNK